MMLLISFLINLMFLNFNNPLIMIMLLLIQTLMVILMMGKIYKTFWFSYIMFLVFIGGLFILFIYIISLSFNNKFYFKMKKTQMFMSMMLFFFMMMNMKNIDLFNYETYNMYTTHYSFMIKENHLHSIKFFNMPNNLINLLLVMYLFLLLIIVVKITNFNKGPIKSMN